MSEMRKWAERDAREEAHETPHERISALRDAILARLRSGSEPGHRWVNGVEGGVLCGDCGVDIGDDEAEDPCWNAARPSGGEGAPEPDGWVPMTPAGPKWGSFSRKRREAEYYGDGIRGVRAVYLRLPPEPEACSTCTEGAPPYFCRECVHRREEGLREALEAEAREPDEGNHPEPGGLWGEGWHPDYVAMVERGRAADREAEIRADERRKVLEETKGEDPTWYADDSPPGTDPNVFVAGVRFGLDLVTEALARLSPTDEQESPNRSDEP